ncbi:MAG: hypothetical protein ABI443_13505 [Chthoniobacterales bacterium]
MQQLEPLCWQQEHTFEIVCEALDVEGMRHVAGTMPAVPIARIATMVDSHLIRKF